MTGRKQTPNVLDALMGGTSAKPQAFDLSVPEDFTRDEWELFGGRIATADAKIRFVIGDWIVAGNRKWGSMYDDAERITGKSNQYLRECVMVVNTFDLLSRDNKLSWSHHKTLCSVPDDQRPAFIETVKANGLSVAETRKLITPAPKLNPPTPGQAYTGGNSSTLTGEVLPPEPDAAGQHTPRGTCKICNRPLTSADSVAAGMGDVCAAHASRDAGIEAAKGNNIHADAETTQDEAHVRVTMEMTRERWDWLCDEVFNRGGFANWIDEDFAAIVDSFAQAKEVQL